MSRARDYVGLYPTRAACDEFDTSVSPSHYGVEFGKSIQSTIVDVGLPKPHPLVYNAVSHQTRRASMLNSPRWTFQKGSGSQRGFWQVDMGVTYTGGISPPSVGDWDDLTIALSDDVRGILQSKSQLFVTAAEVLKTWRMIRNPFSILKLLRGKIRGVKGNDDLLRAADRRSLFDLSKSASGKYLEYRYGWKPLFYDLKNLCGSMGLAQGILTNANPDGSWSSRLSRGKQTAGTIPPPTVPESAWKANILSPGVGTSNGQTRVVFLDNTVTQRVSCIKTHPKLTFVDAVRGFTSAFGVYPSQWLSTIWELVPYSFVVDWFIDTDRIMNPLAVEHLRNDESLSCFGYSVKSSLKYKAEYIAPSWPYGYSTYAVWDEYPVASGEIGEITDYQRTPGWPTDEGAISFFNRNGISAIHMADALGLIVQLFRQ